jgi:excinuclease ABC subunit A
VSAVDHEKIIRIRGARTHNLRDISLDIPRDKLVVVTGLSGSGKSSLAFDTIYAEGQRKYVESLSAYARQFLGQMARPDVDLIEGLPPTIAIAQQSARTNPRSTVATTTEVYDYLRLLFARIGEPHCPRCGKAVSQQTIPQIVDAILAMPQGSRLMILAPLVRDQKGNHKAVLERIVRDGFVRARIDGVVTDVREAAALDKNAKHDIEAVVDRVVLGADARGRIAESVEAAVRLADGLAIVSREDAAKEPVRWVDQVFNQRYACIDCGVSLPELEPRLFSFNSPHGACRECDGLGVVLEFDEELVVPDPSLPLEGGAIAPLGRAGGGATFAGKLLRSFCEAFKVSPSTPYSALAEKTKRILLKGTTAADEREHGVHFEGVLPALHRRWKSTDSEGVRERVRSFMSQRTCEACRGARLRPESLAVKLGSLNIDAIAQMSIDAAAGFFATFKPVASAVAIADPILREIRRRLSFMIDVGIGYLTLGRTTSTLSGGEAQRIRLATQVGSGLVGVCYVLDEPTSGLHARDTAKLIRTLRGLVEIGNTVLVVEHDADMIAASDWVVDIGPGAGAHGGLVLVCGAKEELNASESSITGKYLRGELKITRPSKAREVDLKKCIEVRGAAENNLKRVNVKFPLGVFCCVTGVSGSGKSTLVNQILLPALRKRLLKSKEPIGAHEKIVGADRVERVLEIDQSPIGRTPRSNPATYTGVFDHVRELFSKTREAKLRGYGPERFSFSVKGGRCEACAGQGTRRIEMHFLPDLFVECDECKGTRYSREMLEIRYRGKSIADVLAMRIEEAVGFFESFSTVHGLLMAMVDVGLGYMSLGQPASTMSGGEAQRIKLAAQLGKQTQSHTLYILDEPTTGLHWADIHRLVTVLNRLCDQGHSIVVIEHHLDVIKQADWVIDLGPEGGEAGGRVLVEAAPDEIGECEASHTGRYLRQAHR